MSGHQHHQPPHQQSHGLSSVPLTGHHLQAVHGSWQPQDIQNQYTGAVANVSHHESGFPHLQAMPGYGQPQEMQNQHPEAVNNRYNSYEGPGFHHRQAVPRYGQPEDIQNQYPEAVNNRYNSREGPGIHHRQEIQNQHPGAVVNLYNPNHEGSGVHLRGGLAPPTYPSGSVAMMHQQANQSGQLPGGSSRQQSGVMPQKYLSAFQPGHPLYPLVNHSGKQPGSMGHMDPFANQSGQQPGGAGAPFYPSAHHASVNQQTCVVAQAGNMQSQGGTLNQHEGLWLTDYRAQPLPSVLPLQGLNHQTDVNTTLVPKKLVPPQAAPPKKSVLRIKMDEILRESNAEFMFGEIGTKVEERENYVYYEFPTREDALSACRRFNNRDDGFLFDIKIDVDRTCDTPTRNRVAAVESSVSAGNQSSQDRKRTCESAAVVQGSKRQKVMHRPLFIAMHPRPFKWKPVKQFCAIEGNAFVAYFKFDLATVYGSISSDVSMRCSTPVGCAVFIGLLGYMGNAWRAGLSWGGRVTLEDLMVSSCILCAILPFPTHVATDKNIALDVQSVVSNLVDLFTLDGEVPPYFDDLVRLATNTPTNISSNTQELEQYLLQLVNHMSLWPEEKIISFLEAFHILFKNLDDQEKTDMNTDGGKTIATGPWKKPTKMDWLLNQVFEGSKGVLLLFLSDEAQYLRHFGIHSNDKIYNFVKDLRKTLLSAIPRISLQQIELDWKQIIADNPQPVLTTKEKVMVMAYYFNDFLAKFASFLFKSMEKKKWIKELCTPFIKKPYEMGAAPLGSLILEGASDPCHILFEALNGSVPVELVFYLKMVIRALWYNNKFHDELSKRMVLHKSSHLHDDDISCALCTLSGTFTSLSTEKQPNSAPLLNILANAYSENKDIVKGGRHYHAELLEMIYRCLHTSSIVFDHGIKAEPDSGSGSWECKSGACLSHALFGLDCVQSFACGTCGDTCEKKTNGKFIHCLTTTSLIMQKSKYPRDTFGALLGRIMLDKLEYCQTCKENRMVPQGYTTIPSPFTFSLVLEWSPDDRLNDLFETISTEIELSCLYRGLQSTSNRHLVSVICQEEDGHFFCFAFETNRWIMHGEDISEVGSWDDVIVFWKEHMLRPIVLLFGDMDYS